MYNILLLVCLYLYFSCLLWFVVCNVFLLTLGCCGGHTNAAISNILLVYVVYLYCCIGFGCLLCFVGFMLACRDTNAAMGKVSSSCFQFPPTTFQRPWAPVVKCQLSEALPVAHANVKTNTKTNTNMTTYDIVKAENEIQIGFSNR